MTYTIEVSNLGPGTASNVILTVDPAFPPATLSPVEPTQGTCVTVTGTTDVFTCYLGSLASGTSATVTFEAISSQNGNFRNFADVAADQADPIKKNNSSILVTRLSR